MKIYGLIIFLLLLFSFFLFVLFPDNARLAGTTCIPIGNQPPGFEVAMLRVAENIPLDGRDFFSKMIYGGISNDHYIPIISRKYDGADIIVKEFSASGDSSYESHFNVADVIYPLNNSKEIIESNGALSFEKMDGTSAEESISVLHGIIDGQYITNEKFILGTDHMGRDIFSLVLVATRGTFLSAFAVTFITLIIGFVFGLIAGLLKGKMRLFAMWLVRSLSSIPSMLLIIAVMFVIGNGFWHVCLASGIILSLRVTQVIISCISLNREKRFVEAASVLGISRIEILRKYILRDILKPVFASASTIFSAAILVESSLNFLGIGFRNQIPSWGRMIRENYGYIFLPGYEYLIILPGIAITVVCLIFVGLARRSHIFMKEEFNWTIV